MQEVRYSLVNFSLILPLLFEHQMASENPKTIDLKSFIQETGGGEGKFCTSEICKSKFQRGIFQQQISSKDQVTAFGRIRFPATKSEPKHYLRVPQNSDPETLLQFVENVWSLPRPKFLIGITGSATEMELTADLDHLLNELMLIACKTDAWLISGGTRAGIMKLVGELCPITCYFVHTAEHCILFAGQARYRFGGTIPLIGFASWGAITNNEDLVVKKGEVNYGYLIRKPIDYEKTEKEYAKNSENMNEVLLEENHSHFILVRPMNCS